MTHCILSSGMFCSADELIGTRLMRYGTDFVLAFAVMSYFFFREDDVLEHSSIVKIVFFMAFLRIILYGLAIYSLL